MASKLSNALLPVILAAGAVLVVYIVVTKGSVLQEKSDKPAQAEADKAADKTAGKATGKTAGNAADTSVDKADGSAKSGAGGANIIATPGGKMALIPAGTFLMGSPEGADDAKQAHEVRLDAFYMDVCEVAQEAYQNLTAANPSRFGNPKNPVDRVRWTDAVRYCNARSEKEGLKPCYSTETWECDFSANGYRLPTEAEWEYAARGGSKGALFFASGEKLDQYAWYRLNSEEKTHPVGTKAANPFGLRDIYGNVAEWCNDFYAPDYYANSPVANPRGPETGKKRVLRGGAWASRPAHCNSVERASDDPVTADICQGYDVYGFRCVKAAPAGGQAMQ